MPLLMLTVQIQTPSLVMNCRRDSVLHAHDKVWVTLLPFDVRLWWTVIDDIGTESQGETGEVT